MKDVICKNCNCEKPRHLDWHRDKGWIWRLAKFCDHCGWRQDTVKQCEKEVT